MAYYSFLKKKIKVLKSVKLKQQDVPSEVLITAVDSGEMLSDKFFAQKRNDSFQFTKHVSTYSCHLQLQMSFSTVVHLNFC